MIHVVASGLLLSERFNHSCTFFIWEFHRHWPYFPVHVNGFTLRGGAGLAEVVRCLLMEYNLTYGW